ncbi:MAG: AraC family transcriptional regulator [Treponema sp.]|nr:AraC family transcriptional regulator [Spirochaetia bacterium]MDY4901506.1 AraC family transcriptional regulator [Treponema sp.]
MSVKEELAQTEFKNREHSVNHIPYDREMSFYQSIRNGDMAEMERLFKPLCTEGFGVLSKNPLRNLKYHLIITVAFITRYCIEGGLEMEQAYNLSDIYIQKIDVCTTEESVHSLHAELCRAYVKKMAELKKKSRFSKPVTLAIDYIYDNLHSKILLEDLAKVSGLSESYLSKIFHSETGLTVSQYITAKKIESAKNLLQFTQYSTAEISSYLCFSSESYFINIFKKETNLTPKQFRNLYFRNKTFE